MADDLTHRELAHVATRWLLGRRWAWVACYELALGGGQADAIAVSKAPDQEVLDLERLELAELRATWEGQVARYVEARKAWVAAGEEGRPPKRPSYPRRRWTDPKAAPAKGRVGVVEVKRTREDLLQDLRAGKLLRYEPYASQTWLAGTSAALRLEGRTAEEVLEELGERGLPATWGVLLLPTTKTRNGLLPSGTSVTSLRGARHRRDVPEPELRLRTVEVARSLSYRTLSGAV